ncbi:sporulation protein YpjB [Paenibacillus amylolyticus]|uniref:sporulation protein YpjB n=1 Tax=Paenibacillus amylolyticus TaxID=1451 RepID=UPI003EC022AB
MKGTLRSIAGWLVVTLMALLLWTNASYRVSAQSDDSRRNVNQGVSSSYTIAQLNEEAAVLYRRALENNMEEVRASITRISNSLGHISFEGQTSVEGIHALSETVVEVKEAAAKFKGDKHFLQQASAKLRLAVDSLANPAKPLWLQYYKIVKNDLDALSLAANQNQGATTLANRFIVLEEHYETIRPAAIIRLEPYQIVQMDAWLSHLKGLTYAKQSDVSQLRSMTSHGEELVNQLFGREKDESAFVPFVQGPDRRAAGLAISSVIVAVLSYAGYRKYRAQQ